MKAMIERGDLVLRGRRGETRLPLARIDAWDMIYQQAGRRLLAFHLLDRTQFVRLPGLTPAARADLSQTLTRLLGRGPDGRLLSEVAGMGRGVYDWSGWLEALLDLLTLF